MTNDTKNTEMNATVEEKTSPASPAVLLPTARVDIYALNPETIEVSNNLIRDWRFSRVALRVADTSIKGAITDYQEYVSPDLVIIEVDKMDDSLIENLSALAEHCVEGTDAIIIGPQNDVRLYRELIALGVNDYLVGPIKETELSGVISKVLLDKKGLLESTLIAVIGSKGGVGVSTIAQSMAVFSADILKHRTFLLDAAGSWSTLNMPFNVNNSSTLHDAVQTINTKSEDDVNRILHKDTQNLTLLPSGGDPLLENITDADSFEDTLDKVMSKHPVVVVDLSSSEAELRQRTLKKASHIIVVSTPLLSALRNCRSLMRELNDVVGFEKNPSLVINMQGICPAHEVSKKDLEEVLESETDLFIPYDSKAFISAEIEATPISRHPAGKKTLSALLELTEQITPKMAKSKSKSTAKKEGFFDNLFKKS